MVWGELALAEQGTRECVLTFHPCMSEAVLFTHPGQAVQADVIQAKVTRFGLGDFCREEGACRPLSLGS